MSWAPALVSALVCGMAGLLVPALLARLPEPPAEEAGAEDGREDGTVPTYAEVAARPGLRGRAAVAAAVAGGLAGLGVGWDWSLPAVLLVVPVGVALAVADLHTHRLPKALVLPLTSGVVALLVLASLLEQDTAALLRAAVGLVGARGFYWVLWWVRSSGMGFGDVRLAAPLGAVLAHLGWAELVVGLWAGFLVFGLPGLVLALVRRDREMLRTPYPFGPAMLAGALLGVLVGGPLAAGLVAG